MNSNAIWHFYLPAKDAIISDTITPNCVIATTTADALINFTYYLNLSGLIVDNKMHDTICLSC